MSRKQQVKSALSWLSLVGLASVATSAAGQLGPDGSPITTSNYTIQLTYGVVISTSPVVGLAGAAASLAQGVEGGLQNPSAVAYRGPQWPDWYDYWLALGSIIGAFGPSGIPGNPPNHWSSEALGHFFVGRLTTAQSSLPG